MIRQHGNLVQMHVRFNCRELDYFTDLSSIHSANASRAQARVPRDMREDPKCPMCHRVSA